MASENGVQTGGAGCATAVSIRALRDRDERQIAFDWARAEGWWPGEDDVSLGTASDEGGWFCAELDGRIVAVVCGLRLSPDLGFIGLYICHPDHRRRGLALPVFKRALSYLGDQRNVALDAVEAQVDNYAKLGFRREYKTWRVVGIPACGQDQVDPRVRRVDAAAVSAIAEFDERHVSGYARPAFFAALAASASVAAAALYSSGGRVLGFVAVRPAFGQDGARAAFRVGPLLATSVADARSLLAWAASQHAGETLALDVIERNVEFMEALESAGFEKLWGCIRMYTRGPPPRLQVASIFSISCWELQVA